MDFSPASVLDHISNNLEFPFGYLIKCLDLFYGFLPEYSNTILYDVHVLPTEVWFHILSFINFKDIVHVSETCKYFRSMIISNLLTDKIELSMIDHIYSTKIKNDSYWCKLITPILEKNNWIQVNDKPCLMTKEKYIEYQNNLRKFKSKRVKLHEIWQTEVICGIAVDQGYGLSKLKYQNDYICIKVVEKYPYEFPLVKQQTQEICLRAVKVFGNTLQYVEQQTREICIAAVINNGRALRFVKQQTSEICLLAVKSSGYALEYVEQQTAEICMAAVAQESNALRFVKQQTVEICLLAVKGWGFSLQYVKEQTEDICFAAIHNHPFALKYVASQNDAICLYAIERNVFVLKYVKHRNEVIDSIAVQIVQRYKSRDRESFKKRFRSLSHLIYLD